MNELKQNTKQMKRELDLIKRKCSESYQTTPKCQMMNIECKSFDLQKKLTKIK